VASGDFPASGGSKQGGTRCAAATMGMSSLLLGQLPGN
jgi:hypothetical protein